MSSNSSVKDRISLLDILINLMGEYKILFSISD